MGYGWSQWIWTWPKELCRGSIPGEVTESQREAPFPCTSRPALGCHSYNLPRSLPSFVTRLSRIPFFSWFTIFMESRRLGWFPSAFSLKIATLFKVQTAQPKDWAQTAAQSQSQWPQPESQRLASTSSSPSPSSSEPELLQSSIFHIPTPGHGAHKRTATGQMRRHEYKPTRLHTSTHAHTREYHFYL